MHEQPNKIGKLDFIKIKNFCASKDIIEKVKRQPTNWEKTLASHVSDKAPVSRIYKELLQLNNSKTNSPILKWSKDLNGHFSKNDIWTITKNMKRCSILLVIQGDVDQNTMRYHFMTTSMAIQKLKLKWKRQK